MSSPKKPSKKRDRLSNLNLKPGAAERVLGVLRDKLRRGEVPEGEFSLTEHRKESHQDS